MKFALSALSLAAGAMIIKRMFDEGGQPGTLTIILLVAYIGVNHFLNKELFPN